MDFQMHEKKHLSATGLIETLRRSFSKIPNHENTGSGRKETFPLVSCLMAGIAMFKIKSASLLDFDQRSHCDPVTSYNIKKLFRVKEVPSDSQLRERLDKVDPSLIQPAFKRIFALFQRAKGLEKYVYLDGKYLVNCDGTGCFSSKTVRCKHCCKKEHRDGTTTFYHQITSAVLSHPYHKQVFPLDVEPVTQEENDDKNDCELNASERLLKRLRRNHPHLKIIIVEDGLYSRGPHIKLLKELDMNFILTVKEKGNKTLFEWLKGVEWEEKTLRENGHTHRIRWINGMPLNDTHPEIKVNVVDYMDDGGEKRNPYKKTWITDIEVSEENCYKIAKGGRNRWTIENETFNTLKNQGYNFEHNYGHGNEHLCSVLSLLMMLAFLVDQIEEASCKLFKNALKAKERKKYFWEYIRSFFAAYMIESWAALYLFLAGSDKAHPLVVEGKKIHLVSEIEALDSS